MTKSSNATITRTRTSKQEPNYIRFISHKKNFMFCVGYFINLEENALKACLFLKMEKTTCWNLP